MLQDGVNNEVIERFLVMCNGRCASWSRGIDQTKVGYPALAGRCLLQALPYAHVRHQAYWKAQPIGKENVNILGPFYAMAAYHNMIPLQLRNAKSCVQYNIIYFYPEI